MKEKRSDADVLGKLIGAWITKISEVYRSVKIVGTLVIVGGVLSFVLTFLAATPFLNPEPYEFMALAALAAVLIVSGGLLYAFVANLEYKWFVASRGMDLKALDEYLKKGETSAKAGLLDQATGEQ